MIHSDWTHRLRSLSCHAHGSLLPALQKNGCSPQDFSYWSHGWYSVQPFCYHSHRLLTARRRPQRFFHNAGQYNHNPGCRIYDSKERQKVGWNTVLPLPDPVNSPVCQSLPADHHRKIPGLPSPPDICSSPLLCCCNRQYRNTLLSPHHFPDRRYKNDPYKSDK